MRSPAKLFQAPPATLAGAYSLTRIVIYSEDLAIFAYMTAECPQQMLSGAVAPIR